MSRFVQLEAKNILAARGVATGLILMLLAGLYAIELGHRIIGRQRAVLAASPVLQQEHLRKTLALHGGSPTEGPGNLLYYLNHFTGREPSRFAPVSIGLRDVNPYNLKVHMLALEGQLYDAEIGNPEAQALGNFDLTFLLVFLYPLLIIAFTHNTLSVERESGTWDLICSNPISPLRMLGAKACLRFAPVPAVWMVTVAAAVVRLNLPFDGRLLCWIGISLLYLLFWFAVSLLVIALGRSSNFNAQSLLCIWLALAILIPVAANVGVATMLPVSGALEVTIRQREGYHNKWDRPREQTMQAFYRRFPEHSSFPAPADRFSWAWYYAMQQLGDEESAAASAQLKATLRLRELWSDRLAWLAPPALVQSAISRLAGTGLTGHLAYLDSVRAHHENVRRFFYPFLFRDAPIPAVDWAKVPRHSFSDETLPFEFGLELAALVVLPAILIAAAASLLRTKV